MKKLVLGFMALLMLVGCSDVSENNSTTKIVSNQIDTENPYHYYENLFKNGKFIDVEYTVDMKDYIVQDRTNLQVIEDADSHVYSVPIKLENGETQRLTTIQPLVLYEKDSYPYKLDYIKIKGQLLVDSNNKPLNNKYILKDATITTNNLKIKTKEFLSKDKLKYGCLDDIKKEENDKRTERVKREQDRKEYERIFN